LGQIVSVEFVTVFATMVAVTEEVVWYVIPLRRAVTTRLVVQIALGKTGTFPHEVRGLVRVVVTVEPSPSTSLYAYRTIYRFAPVGMERAIFQSPTGVASNFKDGNVSMVVVFAVMENWGPVICPHGMVSRVSRKVDTVSVYVPTGT